MAETLMPVLCGCGLPRDQVADVGLSAIASPAPSFYGIRGAAVRLFCCRRCLAVYAGLQ